MGRTKGIVDIWSSKTKRLLRDETCKINVTPDFRKGDIDRISRYVVHVLDSDEDIRYRWYIVNKQYWQEETSGKQMVIAPSCTRQ
jgi:hypothetical protein